VAKIAEHFHEDGDKIIHVKQHDFNPSLNQAAAMRENGNAHFGDSVCVGVVDQALMGEWAKEAGIAWTDPAMEDVVKRKLMSGEFDKLRVWKGNY
jgi:hypothetical protein|tara:strand:+ start:633 stop:917 length:285 start_codon:yes stop_codon:yes gene_type:complete